MSNKWEVIGSEGQIASIDYGASLSRAKKCCKQTRFSNGCRALVGMTTKTKKEALKWQARYENALANMSGKLGHWLVPTFIVRKVV